ncbi:MAG: c-type cytochrome [Bergeyella zoohelcum]|nr:c-type cytochrome [Bergeyella zoohelcum]
MKNVKFFALSAMFLGLISCGGDKNAETSVDTTTAQTEATTDAPAGGTGDYDPKRGLGKYDESNVDVSKFDVALASKGEATAQVKCASCHKPTDEKLVGPGWKGITQRQTPQWIMNFISNPDPMIDVDPALQKQLELCLVRMPNQGLSDDEARSILEYMRQIDGAK